MSFCSAPCTYADRAIGKLSPVLICSVLMLLTLKGLCNEPCVRMISEQYLLTYVAVGHLEYARLDQTRCPW